MREGGVTRVGCSLVLVDRRSFTGVPGTFPARIDEQLLMSRALLGAVTIKIVVAAGRTHPTTGRSSSANEDTTTRSRRSAALVAASDHKWMGKPRGRGSLTRTECASESGRAVRERTCSGRDFDQFTSERGARTAYLALTLAQETARPPGA